MSGGVLFLVVSSRRNYHLIDRELFSVASVISGHSGIFFVYKDPLSQRKKCSKDYKMNSWPSPVTLCLAEGERSERKAECTVSEECFDWF